MKVLVIEDEPDLAEVVARSLEAEQFVVETAKDHRTALDKIADHDYDLILLDIMLPGGNGLDVLRELRALGKTGNVIIISAKDSIEDKLAGLDLGADDYLTKPFHIAELNARVRSVLRRKAFGGNSAIAVGNLRLHPDDRTAHVDDEPLPLNRKEFDMLLYLLMNKDRLVARTSLAEHVWGDHIGQADDLGFIYSQVKNLRRKLRAGGAAVEIRAVYGIGYKLVEAS